MSVGIVRVQKMGGGSVKGIEIHDRREKEGISHTNKDIDWEKTKLNYDLHPDQNCNFNQAVKKRINELHLPKAVRKDAVVMAQVLVTSDTDFFKNLSPNQTKKFFEDSYKFLCNRYGKENVVSATIHMDERTPHMHFNFVPVSADGRLSAKSILTRQSLIEQQTAFYEKVGKDYGLERGIQGGKKKHLEIAELKEQTALAQAREAEDIVHEATEVYNDVMSDITNLQGEIESLHIERDKAVQETQEAHNVLDNLHEKKNAVQGEINALRSTLEDLRDKVVIMDEAIRIKDREGVSVSGGMGEWQKRIAEAKEKAGDINRLRLMERFISHPQVKPVWEEFIRTLQRGKGLDRDR